jgi:gallate decarboxylase subunit D
MVKKDVVSFDISEREDHFEVFAQVSLMGNDLLVVLSGGNVHIWAIGMAVPRPSLKDLRKISATSSVFTYIGHKEDVVVKAMSEGLAKKLNKKVVVIAGIHWDGLKMEEVEIIVELCDRILKRIIKKVGKK